MFLLFSHLLPHQFVPLLAFLMISHYLPIKLPVLPSCFHHLLRSLLLSPHGNNDESDTQNCTYLTTCIITAELYLLLTSTTQPVKPQTPVETAGRDQHNWPKLRSNKKFKLEATVIIFRKVSLVTNTSRYVFLITRTSFEGVLLFSR